MLETRHTGEIVNINTQSNIAMIHSEKCGNTFIAFAKSFVGGINAYALGERVSFEPERSTQQDAQPIAVSIKRA
ncbi:hypothetical protein [Yersinia sp. 1652 StPb PI]|uniref:hypothetical protein n=1 Tax=Yersinia sp. 1652 StPb PI TaxID=3061649 RepID=UPI00355AECD8